MLKLTLYFFRSFFIVMGLWLLVEMFTQLPLQQAWSLLWPALMMGFVIGGTGVIEKYFRERKQRKQNAHAAEPTTDELTQYTRRPINPSGTLTISVPLGFYYSSHRRADKAVGAWVKNKTRAALHCGVSLALSV